MAGSSWSEDEARRKLAAQERSGLSLAAWCDQEGVSPQRIYYWRDRLRTSSPTVSRPHFVELAVRPTAAAAPSGVIELVWPSGHVVRVPAAMGLAEVLRAAGLAPC